MSEIMMKPAKTLFTGC